MRKGKIASQVAHASLGAILKSRKTLNKSELVIASNEYIEAWLNGPFTKIVVKCDSLDELLALEQACLRNDVRHCKITDAGNTVFDGVPTVTCLAVGPDDENKINQITSHLQLL